MAGVAGLGGAGERGVGVRLAADDAVAALGGTYADVTDAS